MSTFSWWSLLVLVTFLGIASVSGNAQAQWNIAAPNLLHGTDTIGAMQFRDGIIWAGGSNLWSSPDSGKTWNPNIAFPTDYIWDIAFFDRLHGMVATMHKGFFITVDGGNNWLQEFPKDSNFVKVGYDGSDSILLALTLDGLFFSSTNGGTTWEKSFPIASGSSQSFAVAEDGSIYVDAAFPDFTGVVMVSSDLGQTWNSRLGNYNGDSWSISADTCDPKRLYLANEEWQETGSNSNFYLSTDGGGSWQSTASQAAPFLSGTMSTTTDGVFLGSRDSSGIHRSMDRGLTWKNIGGPNLTPDTRNLATVNDNIILAIDSGGNIWLTVNGGGDSVQSAPAGTLTLAPTQLFSTDTLMCDSVQRAIAIMRSGCPVPHLTSAILGGPDSASFQIDSITTDSIYITLFPKKIGGKNATLTGQLDNGTQQTVQLSGFVSQYAGTFTYSPNSLFTNDTISCDSLIDSVALAFNGCRPPSLMHFGITGPDAGSFRIVDSTSDSIYVLWSSQKPGAQQAWLVAQLNNGQFDSIPLNGFSETKPLAYSLTPQSLFNSDSLFIACSPAVPAQILFFDTACIWPNVTSERIIGVDSADYTITDSIGSPVISADSVMILFNPKDTGLRSATYQLTLNDGTIINVPLSGVGLAEHFLSLTSSNEKTDTIGGTIAVPITVNGLARVETIELVLHYPLADLVYDSSVDLSGVKVDVPGEQWSGRSLLRIPNAKPGAVTAYALFNVFSDTDYQPLVTFDSVTVPSAFAPCEYSLPTPMTDTITPLEGCGIPILSQFVHFGAVPTLRIQPNPTSTGLVELTSSIDLGDAQIEVYDVLGSERETFPATIKSNVPVMLALPFESGLYLLRIATAGGHSSLRVMINK